MQASVFKIIEDGLHPAFRFAEEDGIGVPHRFVGMEHGRDTAKDDLNPPFPVPVGNLPAPLDLTGQHHGDADQIGRCVEVDPLDIFIRKINIHIIGQCCGKDDRSMRRQVKLRLPVQLLPFRVDQFKFHFFPYDCFELSSFIAPAQPPVKQVRR